MIKKGVKCFGLLSVFSIIFGLSLSASSDVSALKYAYNAFPLYRDSFYLCTDDYCNGTTSHSSLYFSTLFDSSIDLSYDSDLVDFDKSGYTLCQSINNLGTIWSVGLISSRNQFEFTSNTVFYKQPATQFYPSFYPNCLGYKVVEYDYDSIYAASYNLSTGGATALVDGVDSFFNRDDPSFDSGSVKIMSVPLTLDYNTFDVIPSGTTLEWDFGLVADSPNGFPYVDPNLVVDLDISYHTLDPYTSSYSDFFNSWRTTAGSSPTISVDPVCIVDFNYLFPVENGELQILVYSGFNVHCSYTAPTDLYYVYPVINIRGSGDQYNPSSFLEYDSGHFYFSGSYLITDGDSTWSGSYANPQPSGSKLENAPGYHQLYGYSSPDCIAGDFFCQLGNLFTFDFINPFSPIFALFSNNNSCAFIPTLSQMLHSEESQVCPFFSPTIRDIVTPVLGLSSMMVVFGFVVRWLGSRSGNFVEDTSDGFDSGGLHIGRRRK